MDWYEPVKYVNRGKGTEMACPECGAPLPDPFYRVKWRYALPFCTNACADKCKAPPELRGTRE